MSQEIDMRRVRSVVTLEVLATMKRRGDRIACLTAYDASFAALLDEMGIEVILVGDSLGMVIQGEASTRPVSVDHMVYHTRAVARGTRCALRVVDMPYESYLTPKDALTNARRLVEAGAQLVKIEGACPDIVTALAADGIPVCGHLGLLPQSVTEPAGYRVQGRDPVHAARLLDEAGALQTAGAMLLVVECVPAALGAAITAALDIPVIGIGAGPACDGQVLVLYDMLGIGSERKPRFVHDFLAGQGSMRAAIESYVRAVKTGAYPTLAHVY